jgi:hypothetical protein
MTPRTKILILTMLGGASLALLTARPAVADPPPWAGRWYNHGKHCSGDDDRYEDVRVYRRPPEVYRREVSRSDLQCGRFGDRIRYDQSKIRQVEPTGRHRKALQWYREDLANAYRGLDRCRYGSAVDARYEQGINPGYDPYYSDEGGYYPPSDRGFRFKDDWPALLGLFLQTQVR